MSKDNKQVAKHYLVTGIHPSAGFVSVPVKGSIGDIYQELIATGTMAAILGVVKISQADYEKILGFNKAIRARMEAESSEVVVKPPSGLIVPPGAR